MLIEYSISISLDEACLEIGVEQEQVYAIVEHGIIAPDSGHGDNWTFDLDMICRAKRAIRLQRELHLDWSAVALLVSLLDERDRLRTDNDQLRSQLTKLTSH